MSEDTIKKILLECYQSIFGDLLPETVYYCSVPITTGKRCFDWLSSIGKSYTEIDTIIATAPQEHYLAVVEPNIESARQFVNTIKLEFNEIVIDPTQISPIRNWQQQEWLDFWRTVIERYVTEIFFIDNWQYSAGCVYEFWLAQHHRIQALTKERHLIEIAEGINLISTATKDLKKLEADTTHFDRILQNLRGLL